MSSVQKDKASSQKSSWLTISSSVFECSMVVGHEMSL